MSLTLPHFTVCQWFLNPPKSRLTCRQIAVPHTQLLLGLNRPWLSYCKRISTSCIIVVSWKPITAYRLRLTRSQQLWPARMLAELHVSLSKKTERWRRPCQDAETLGASSNKTTGPPGCWLLWALQDTTENTWKYLAFIPYSVYNRTDETSRLVLLCSPLSSLRPDHWILRREKIDDARMLRLWRWKINTLQQCPFTKDTMLKEMPLKSRYEQNKLKFWSAATESLTRRSCKNFKNLLMKQI